MVGVIILLCSFVSVNANTVLLRYREFQDFKLTHGKVYASEQEERLRLETFSRNLQEIEEHNRLYERGLKSWYMGVNQFTDMTPEEFASYLTMQGPPPDMSNATVFKSSVEPAPESIDWRQHGIVTEVKQQGTCRCCWSFSSTGAIEGVHAKTTGQLVSLSEQQLVDCVTSNSGCRDGYMTNAFEYVIRHGGIASEADYPYLAAQGECQPKPTAAEIDQFGVVNPNEESLRVVVGVMGPVSVAVDATYFQHYEGGVFSHPLCSSVHLNHALLAVGYGMDAQLQRDYWLIKNSWGTAWGEDGYIRLIRNFGNHCGVATNGSFPIIEKTIDA